MNDLISAFVEVARTGSVAKAALNTHITNSALLKKIDHLENEVGIKLFVRTHQGMILTKAGYSFLTDSELLLNYYQNAVAKARNIENMPRKTIIRLGTSLIAPASYLNPFLNEKIKKVCF